MKRFRSRFLACWFCVVLNLAAAFGYAQSTVLCLTEEGRHALEFSTDGYRCYSSTTMSQPGFHPSDKGETPPTEEHCGSCVDTPLSTLSFATNFSLRRPPTPGFDFAMPVHIPPAFRTIGALITESGLALLSIVVGPTCTSLRSTVLLI